MLVCDVTKLSRDYKKEPIKKGEIINKDDLSYMFFELNWSRDEIGEYLHTPVLRVRGWLTKYGFKKSRELYMKKARETCMRKYGVASPLQSKAILEKTKVTLKNKYGVDNPFRLDFVKEKIKVTCLKKYGKEYIQRVPAIQKKARETIKKRYGVSVGMQVRVKHPEIWYDNDKLTTFIKSGNGGNKWTTPELAEYFNLTDSPVQVRIGELGLWSYITQSSSKEERELTNILLDLGEQVDKYKDKTTEFDIYIPGKKIAIEFNGNYWHSTRVRKDYKYHLKKTQYANSMGIFLYHVFEYEWLNRKEQVLGQIKNILGLNNTTVYARKCVVKEVSLKEAQDFQENNHIQGAANASVKLGLYYHNNLVSLMTFGKSRFNKNIEWELVRFCSLIGTNVLGGASKLFSYFIKNYNPESIISYSDIAKTRGGLYNKLGFVQTGTAEPNYVWVYHTTVLSRYKCQKHILIKQGFGNLGNTEKEIMEARNFAQVFDCGTRVHIWRNNNGNTSNK